MNKMTYLLSILFAISLVFIAGNSFAQNKGYQADIKDYWPWVSASKMIGSQLRDRSGNYVGEIKDLVIDPSSGRISNVILSNFRSHLANLPVPFDTVHKDPRGEMLVYNPPKGAELYYGQAPYWSEGLYADQTWPMEGIKASKLIGATVRTSNGEVTQIKDLKIDFEYGLVYAVFPSNVDGQWKRLLCLLAGWQKAAKTHLS